MDINFTLTKDQILFDTEQIKENICSLLLPAGKRKTQNQSKGFWHSYGIILKNEDFDIILQMNTIYACRINDSNGNNTLSNATCIEYKTCFIYDRITRKVMRETDILTPITGMINIDFEQLPNCNIPL